MSQPAHARVFIAMAALIACMKFTVAPAGAQSTDFAGIYRGGDVELTLANHPHWPKVEYVGLLVKGKDQRVYAAAIRYDSVKGCHGVIYNGTIAKQQAVELKLEGQTLTVRYYEGPTLKLKRVPK